jgi:hypothetical protein
MTNSFTVLLISDGPFPGPYSPRPLVLIFYEFVLAIFASWREAEFLVTAITFLVAVPP